MAGPAVKLTAEELPGPESEAGKPLLIAHGLFGSGRNWSTLARKFAAERPVSTVDMRNHGASPWADVMGYEEMGADLLASAKDRHAEPIAVLGHSMGGKAAMAAALTKPDAVAALVVADIAPVPYQHSHASFVDAMRSVDLNAISRRSQADPMLAEAIPEAPLRAFILQNLVIEDGRASWRLNLDVLASEMAKLLDWPAELSTRRYDGPTLFLHGGASDYVSDAAHSSIRAAFPKAEIQSLPGAGHWLHAEQPAAFSEAVAQWLRRMD
ncbi:MAG: alpha/beta fold hydrolase [Pseudomonadota bacterium]